MGRDDVEQSNQGSAVIGTLMRHSEPLPDSEQTFQAWLLNPRGLPCMKWSASAAVWTLLSIGIASAQDEEVAAPPPVRPIGTSEVTVSEFMTVDIIVQNDYVTNVLQKLAIQGRRNIVPSPAVERLVSANIYGVPFDDALQGLLKPNGLGYVERDEFIFVYTTAELEELQVGGFGAVSKVLHLDYMRAADARDYVQGMLSPAGSIEITKDFPEGQGGGGGDEVAAALGGGQVSDNSNIYSPNEDEYDLRNAIVVHDLPERVEKIEEFLSRVDTRPAQVLIEASIVQTSLTEENAFGVDFAMLGSRNFVDFFQAPIGAQPLGFLNTTDPVTGLSSTVVPETGASYAIATPGNTGVGEASIRAGYVDDVGVFLRALDKVTDVTLLSNPKVMTLNRQRTKVFVGKKVGYFETTTVENQVNQTIKYLDTGIVLDVRPFVLKDGRIRLELSPKVSQVSFRNVGSPNGSTQEIPDEQVQTVTTDVLVPEGHTAVLGGLFREDTEHSRTQVPVLGDLPILGQLFGGRDESIRQTEVIFLIKPIVLQDEAVIKAGLDALEYRDDVRVGSRQGLLLWSRERQSARLNLQAQRAQVAGDEELARYKYRRSLGLHPNQPTVIRAMEELDRKVHWPVETSFLINLIDEEYASEVSKGESE
jgi:type IV pilus assembly protein PilQ